MKKTILIALVLGCLVASITNAENYIFVPIERNPYGTEIDLDSFAQEGSLRTYWVRFFVNRKTGQREVHQIVADCANRKRGQYMGTGSLRGVELYSTYSGTVAAAELDLVCANDSPQIAKAPPQIDKPAPRANISPVPRARGSTSTGTGFFVANGFIVTNEHVISGCENLYVSRELLRVRASIRASSKRSDLALLQTDNLQIAKPPSIRRVAQLGEDVIVAGHPLSGLLSSDITVTSGQVNALAGIENDPTLLQISAPVQSGNSGGPVLDRYGNVVGVVVSKLNVSKAEKITGDFAQNINFAIKPEILRLFLDSTNIDYKSAVTQRKLENVEIANAAKKFTVLIECE